MSYAVKLLTKELNLLKNELELNYNRPYHKDITVKKIESIKEVLSQVK